MKNKLDKLIRRLNRLNINIELAANYPWIYLVKVNSKIVIEKFQANHGFTLGFLKLDSSFKYSDIREIFKVIRKYR